MMTAGLLCVGFALLQTDRCFMRIVTCTAQPVVGAGGIFPSHECLGVINY